MTTENNFANISLQNLVDNPDCSEDDVARWVRDNADKFEDESNPGEFSPDKVNALFGDLLNNNALGGLGNLGISSTSGIAWFNVFGAPDAPDEPETEKSKPEINWNLTDTVLAWGSAILGGPDSRGATTPAKKPVKKTSGGGFPLGKIDLGTLLKYAGNSKLRKAYWVLKRVYREIVKLFPGKKKRTVKRAAATKKATKKTTAKKTTIAKKTTVKKTPAKTTTSKKTAAKKATAKKTTSKKTR